MQEAVTHNTIKMLLVLDLIITTQLSVKTRPPTKYFLF